MYSYALSQHKNPHCVPISPTLADVRKIFTICMKNHNLPCVLTWTYLLNSDNISHRSIQSDHSSCRIPPECTRMPISFAIFVWLAVWITFSVFRSSDEPFQINIAERNVDKRTPSMRNRICIDIFMSMSQLCTRVDVGALWRHYWLFIWRHYSVFIFVLFTWNAKCMKNVISNCTIRFTLIVILIKKDKK